MGVFSQGRFAAGAVRGVYANIAPNIARSHLELGIDGRPRPPGSRRGSSLAASFASCADDVSAMEELIAALEADADLTDERLDVSARLATATTTGGGDENRVVERETAAQF